MRKHTLVYLKGMKIQILERFEDMYIPCEWNNCGNPAVDINHADPRGMGGSKLKDNLETLVAMCRKHHLEFEAGLIDKDELIAQHIKNIP